MIANCPREIKFPIINRIHRRKAEWTTMTEHAFPDFYRELQQHSAPGYHVSSGAIDTVFAAHWSTTRSIRLPSPYLEFLGVFGPGRYFAGSLILFPLEEQPGKIDRITARLPEADRAKFFAVGYDGTTEGCYCLDRTGVSSAVFWHSFETSETASIHPDFHQWIEHCPTQLYSDDIYKGYRDVRDVMGVRNVIKERSGFEVRLVKAEPIKVRPPGHEEDFLPRYHRLVVGITKHEESQLRKLTFAVLRSGSAIGLRNIEYVTIDLPEVAKGTEVTCDAYVFDPFNLPFVHFEIIYDPEIDLSSNMRVRYEEIKDLL
jgi:hypothetical protein